MNKTHLPYSQIGILGCDPEFFFRRDDGSVVGSEVVLNKGSVSLNLEPGKSLEEAIAENKRRYLISGGTEDSWVRSGYPKQWEDHYKTGNIVVDGVQAELNPSPNICRANLGNHMRECFVLLRRTLASKGITADLTTAVVEVPKQELDALSDRARTLGCAPSLNLHDHTSTISVDAATYRVRSAGGHIHLGGSYAWLKTPNPLVAILDVLVGNTCVLIDRDPQAAERRKVYGRAGEFRLPPHGLEYRTLSNFWLRAFPLMSLVMGLARMSMNVMVCDSTRKDDFGQDLLKRVDLEKIRTAINLNDLDLAWENWKAVRGWIEERVGDVPQNLMVSSSVHPLGANTVDWFEYFAKKGLSHWFMEDPLTHWCELGEAHAKGWEAFLLQRVGREYKASLVTV